MHFNLLRPVCQPVSFSRSRKAPSVTESLRTCIVFRNPSRRHIHALLYCKLQQCRPITPVMPVRKYKDPRSGCRSGRRFSQVLQLPSERPLCRCLSCFEGILKGCTYCTVLIQLTRCFLPYRLERKDPESVFRRLLRRTQFVGLTCLQGVCSQLIRSCGEGSQGKRCDRDCACPAATSFEAAATTGTDSKVFRKAAKAEDAAKAGLRAL